MSTKASNDVGSRHIFARFGPHGLRQRGLGDMDSTNLLHTIDHVCGQFAAALAHAELQTYATIALVVVLSVLLFPPEGGPDPDQI